MLLERIKMMRGTELDSSVSMLDSNGEMFGFETLVVSNCDGVLDREHLVLVQNGYTESQTETQGA